MSQVTIQFVLTAIFLLQEDVPPIYREFFNAETITNILVIVGAVKLVRNPLNLKGALAVVVTVAVSLIYGVLQFGLSPGGVTRGLVLGALSAASFYITKNIGALLNAYGVGNLKKIVPDAVKFINEHPNLFKKMALGLRYIFLRN